MLRRFALSAALALGAALLLGSLPSTSPPAEAAITYSATAKTNRMTAVRDLLNNGKLEILHSDGSTVLATFTLSATSGTVSGSTLTFSFVSTTVTASATGTATTARLRTSANADVVTGLTVGTSGAELTLNTTTIGSGANVTLSSAAITHSLLLRPGIKLGFKFRLPRQEAANDNRRPNRLVI